MSLWKNQILWRSEILWKGVANIVTAESLYQLKLGHWRTPDNSHKCFMLSPEVGGLPVAGGKKRHWPENYYFWIISVVEIKVLRSCHQKCCFGAKTVLLQSLRPRQQRKHWACEQDTLSRTVYSSNTPESSCLSQSCYFIEGDKMLPHRFAPQKWAAMWFGET